VRGTERRRADQFPAGNRGRWLRLVGIVVYLSVMTWRAIELDVIGQQGQAEGLGQCHVHGVMGGEVMPEFEHAELQRLHRVTHDPQTRVVGQHFARPDGRDPLRRAGDRQAADDAGHLSVQKSRGMHATGLTGDTTTQASQALQAAGLVLGAVTKVTDKYCSNLGTVMSQNPPAGTAVTTSFGNVGQSDHGHAGNEGR
jgi:hypothetical protein